MNYELPRDGAPNKSLLKNITAINTIRAAKPRSTIFVSGPKKRSHIATRIRSNCTAQSPMTVGLRFWPGSRPGRACLDVPGLRLPLQLHMGQQQVVSTPCLLPT